MKSYVVVHLTVLFFQVIKISHITLMMGSSRFINQHTPLTVLQRFPFTNSPFIRTFPYSLKFHHTGRNVMSVGKSSALLIFRFAFAIIYGLTDT